MHQHIAKHDSNIDMMILKYKFNQVVDLKGTGLIEVDGATNPGSIGGGTNAGTIQLNCESNSHGIKLTVTTT